MNILLTNFRRYEKKSFSFENGITKLSGESGIGKTTIFEAIEWCLYGKLKGVKTMKDGKKNNEKTIVSIQMTIPELGEILIDREGLNNVYFYIGDKGCEGVEAQTLIDKIFGVHDMFLLTSYLKAELMHKMISASPAEKRELTSILFPDASKHKLYKDKTTAFKNQLEVEQSELKLLILKLEGKISGIKTSYPDIDDELEDLKEDTVSLKKQLETLLKQHNRYISIKSKYSVLKEQLEGLPEIQPDDDWRSSLADIHKLKLDAVVATSSREEKISSLEKEIGNINKDSLLSLEDINSQLLICTLLLLLKIDDILISLQLLVEKKILAEEYEQSLECKQHNEKAKHILKCPDCSVKLMYVEGVLITADQTIEEKPIKHNINKKDLLILLSSISNLEDLINQKQLIIDLNPTFEGLTKDDLLRLKKKLIDMLNNHLRLLKLEKELSLLRSDNRKYLSHEESNRLSSEEKRLQSLISKNDIAKAQKVTITKLLEDLESNEEWLKEGTLEIERLELQIQSIQLNINQYSLLEKKIKLRLQYLDLLKKLGDAKSRLLEIVDEVNSCAKLIGYLDECYTEYVTNKLTEIAKEVSELGKIFFDDTMNITLLPGRETQNGVLKPSFDITIEYNGKIFEDVKCMSTGEKKRISLILMMVLSKYTSGRMLLLDEALNSISMDRRAIILHEIDACGLFTILSSHDEAAGCHHELILTKQMLD